HCLASHKAAAHHAKERPPGSTGEDLPLSVPSLGEMKVRGELKKGDVLETAIRVALPQIEDPVVAAKPFLRQEKEGPISPPIESLAGDLIDPRSCVRHHRFIEGNQQAGTDDRNRGDRRVERNGSKG